MTQSDSASADFPAAVTNSGNGSDIFSFSSTSSKNWIREIYFDANGDGILQLSELNAGQISQTSSISADASYKIIVRVKVPRGESLNGQIDTAIFTITSQFNSKVQHSASYVTTVRTTNLSVILSADKSTPSAGENITYTLVVSNNGSVPALNISISDMLDAKLEYVSINSTQGTLLNLQNPVQWNVGTINAGGTATVTIVAQVKDRTVPNTIINNQIGVTYSAGNNFYSIVSNLISISVGYGAAYAVNVFPLWSSFTKEANDTLLYRFRVTNNGVVKDIIELEFSSTHNLNWSFYKDANKNGILDLNDTQLTNTNNFKGFDTDTLTAGDSIRIFARAMLNRLPDGTKDSLTLIASSNGKPSVTASSVVVTTVNAENIVSSLTKFPIGNLPAGEEFTYTIAYANNGNSAVETFSVSNEIPENTDYVVNSVSVNGIPAQDNSGIVQVTKNEFNKTVIAVSIGKLSGKTNGSVEYKVRVK